MGIDELLDFRLGQHLNAELRALQRVERVHHAIEQLCELLAYLLLTLL